MIRSVAVAALAAFTLVACDKSKSQVDNKNEEATPKAVSYTHLDVYKRQVLETTVFKYHYLNIKNASFFGSHFFR